MASLRALWQGKPTADGLNSILLSDEIATALSGLLGTPADSVKQVKPKNIVTQLWNTPGALAIVPFDQLTPKLTALALDQQNVLNRDLKIDRYPLLQRMWVSGDAAKAQTLVSALRVKIPITDRDPQRMTSLIMTGVTAIARGTAAVIESRNDAAFPARQIAAVLSRADITHISNEIPFADGCTPNPDLDSIVLCSNPSYLASLKLVGADIIGLTGNHAFDFGLANYVKTLELYDAAGMR